MIRQTDRSEIIPSANIHKSYSFINPVAKTPFPVYLFTQFFTCELWLIRFHGIKYVSFGRFSFNVINIHPLSPNHHYQYVCNKENTTRPIKYHSNAECYTNFIIVLELKLHYCSAVVIAHESVDSASTTKSNVVHWHLTLEKQQLAVQVSSPGLPKLRRDIIVRI